MGFSDIFSDFYASIGFSELHAEAPPKEEEEEKDEGGDDGKGEEEDEVEEGGGEEDGEDEGGEDEGGDGEEEEEEPEDPKPKLEEDCAKSAQCASAKSHYDDCAARVTKQHEDPDFKGPKEDCVEEFFHLQHCATQCAAPKLFRMLK